MVPQVTTENIRLQGDAAEGVNVVYHTYAFLTSKESECQNIPRALDRGLQTFWVLHCSVIFVNWGDIHKYKSSMSMNGSYG